MCTVSYYCTYATKSTGCVFPADHWQRVRREFLFSTVLYCSLTGPDRKKETCLMGSPEAVSHVSRCGVVVVFWKHHPHPKVDGPYAPLIEGHPNRALCRASTRPFVACT